MRTAEKSVATMIITIATVNSIQELTITIMDNDARVPMHKVVTEIKRTSVPGKSG